jgi:hypothetical protein
LKMTCLILSLDHKTDFKYTGYMQLSINEGNHNLNQKLIFSYLNQNVYNRISVTTSMLEDYIFIEIKLVHNLFLRDTL